MLDLGASYADSYRLPELFCGMPRHPGTFPVQYPRANISQAWAAGSVFHPLQATLGLQADAPAGRFYATPTLSPWLPEIHLSQPKVGDSVLHLRLWREGPDSRWEVLDRRAFIEVCDAPEGGETFGYGPRAILKS